MVNHGNVLFILAWSMDALYLYRREDFTHIISYWLLDLQRMCLEGTFLRLEPRASGEMKNSG